MEMNPQVLETARKRLEEIFNSELVNAKAGYDFFVNTHIELVINNGAIICFGEPDEETKKEMKEFELKKIEKEKKLRANIEKIRREQIQGINRLLLRTTEPYFVGRGEHQAVIDIGNNLVAKLLYEKKFSSDEYLSVSIPYPYLRDTAESLRSIGIPVPEYGFLRAGWDKDKIEVSVDVSHDSYRRHKIQSQRLFKRTRKKPVYCVATPLPRNLPNVCITNDLRANGRYKVMDFEEDTAKALPNGNDLIREYQGYFSKLMGVYHKKRIYLKPDNEPFIEYNPHSDNTPEEAVKRMFLLQVPTNRTDLGKLVIGDIDHIKVFR